MPALDVFATADQLRRFLDLEQIDEARAELLLESATGLIRSAARGQRISLVQGEVTRLRAHLTVVLPHYPVVDVTALQVDGVDDLAGWEWSPSGILRAATIPRSGAFVTVTYDHGHDPVPGDVRSLCLQVAARGFDNPEGVDAERLGSYSTSGSGPMTLTSGEHQAIDLLYGVA